MTVKFEKFANSADSTLDGAINDSVTSLTVNDATDFPTDGNFRIIINSELLLVIAVSGEDFTVVRGIEGTTAAAHSNSDAVTLVITEESRRKLVSDHQPMFGESAIVGPLNTMTDDSGNAIDFTDFTLINNPGGSDSGALTDDVGFFLGTSGNSFDIILAGRSAPSTPYTIYVAVSPLLRARTGITGDNFAGIAFRESGSSLIKLFGLTSYQNDTITNGYLIGDANDFDSYGSDVEERRWHYSPELVWLAMADNGTNISFSTSNNGRDFVPVYSQSRTTFFSAGPDQCCVFARGRGNELTYIVVNHWSEQ